MRARRRHNPMLFWAVDLGSPAHTPVRSCPPAPGTIACGDLATLVTWSPQPSGYSPPPESHIKWRLPFLSKTESGSMPVLPSSRRPRRARYRIPEMCRRDLTHLKDRQKNAFSRTDSAAQLTRSGPPHKNRRFPSVPMTPPVPHKPLHWRRCSEHPEATCR